MNNRAPLKSGSCNVLQWKQRRSNSQGKHAPLLLAWDCQHLEDRDVVGNTLRPCSLPGRLVACWVHLAHDPSGGPPLRLGTPFGCQVGCRGNDRSYLNETGQKTKRWRVKFHLFGCRKTPVNCFEVMLHLVAFTHWPICGGDRISKRHAHRSFPFGQSMMGWMDELSFSQFYYCPSLTINGWR